MYPGNVKNCFEKLFGINDLEYSFLVKQYTEKERFYHTLEHISDCLDKLSEVKNFLNDLESVEYAILYHDFFYVPKRKDNEEESANYIYNLILKSGKKEYLAERVKALINLTKHPSIPTDSDAEYLLDIDLSVLGSPANLYSIYEENIRKEYIHVPKILYKIGRTKLLKKFLKQDRIFHTDYFYSKLEEQARANLQLALNKL